MWNVRKILRVFRVCGKRCKFGFYVSYIVLMLLVIYGLNSKVWGSPDFPDFQFKGVYSSQNVLVQYCDNCWLSLPAEYLQSDLVLSISTDDKKKVFSALQNASRANGWELIKNGNVLKAEPIQNDGNLVFISCLSDDVVNVPKYLYHYSRKSDSLKCLKRDSLALLERLKRDSLLSIPALPFVDYELRYYSFSKSFSDKMGVSWRDILASGNLKRVPSFYDSWALYADENKDTTFNYRSLFFSLDSSLSIDWGTEEQTLQRSYNDNGIITNDYEWRKYGIILKIERSGERVKMSYILRDKDNLTSVLQGSAGGNVGDTLFIQGNYNVSRSVVNGVPFLADIPFIGRLFSVEDVENESKNFNLFLIPTRKNIIDSLKTSELGSFNESTTTH